MNVAKLVAIATVGALALTPSLGRAQTVQELKREIDELKAIVKTLQANRQTSAAPAAAAINTAPVASASAGTAMEAPKVAAAPAPIPAAVSSAGSKPWYEKLRLRGYIQLRNGQIVSGDQTAPAGISRLRSVHDGGIDDNTNFTFRRARLVLEGALNDTVSFYFQPDFATAVTNQSNGERREGFAQLRDAYVDVNLNKSRTWKVRLGQSKVPFGWENLQSSSNRLTLDRSDAINSGTISERDIGIVTYYTPAAAQETWNRLSKDGQKLFGNYGVLGFGLFNGQGVNRPEQNDDLMQVAMATWPFELDSLGDGLNGQVLELGASGYRNRYRPELRSGGVSATAFDDRRIGLHAVLYPQPFGFQAEWNWGQGPEFDVATRQIETKDLNGGYVQAMYRVKNFGKGELMPYVRWQTYRGGWKAGTNAPRLETDEFEFGAEWLPMPALELTLAYAKMTRKEADERRGGRAEGDVLRAQVQFNY